MAVVERWPIVEVRLQVPVLKLKHLGTYPIDSATSRYQPPPLKNLGSARPDWPGALVVEPNA